MQWSQIKTLFILCFLILNIFLSIQFINKQKEADVSELDKEEVTFEDTLESERIKMKDIDTDVKKAPYIKASQKEFSESEQKALANLKGQDLTVIDNNFIVSKFDDPVPLSSQFKESDLDSFMKSNMLFADDFVYWGLNEEMNVLVFFQEQTGLPIYFNQHGLLLVYLNDDNEAIFYTQTLLDDPQPQGKKKTLNKPKQAVETLYKRNYLYPGDEVTNVKMGYYTRILSEGLQVFAPTWKVSVTEEKDGHERVYFVNAIEGLVLDSEDVEFLETAIDGNTRKIQSLDGTNKVKDFIQKHLKQLKDEESNRSEEK
jgi:regulatory protein YycI of two-component signal transduction system YycFG